MTTVKLRNFYKEMLHHRNSLILASNEILDKVSKLDSHLSSFDATITRMEVELQIENEAKQKNTPIHS